MKTLASCAASFGLVLLLAPSPRAQVSPPVSKDTLAGVTNYAHVETTVACAGATTPASLAEIKRLGYKSVINLREASEQGADIDGESAAAKAAGISFVHLPFNTRMPDPTLVDNFLKAITDPANVPAFIHCASGNRAAAMWAIKRVEVDNWDTDRALAEATDLGMTSAGMKTFVTDYVQAHKK
jgi:uncharacterized protein (TIGR01244 family)